MGEVHRAHDARLGRDVAVKVLPDQVSSSPERLARFEREARIVASLNHPNIITLYSIEEADGTRFLTMELVEGVSLADRVTPGGLPMAQVLDLMIPVADALSAAHDKGVVHRDLKPANVMIGRDGRVKVLDFGLAKVMAARLPEEQGEPDRTATLLSPLSRAGEVLGTAPYMAPEQIFGEAVDARTDVFSFGILIFEVATGQRPFVGKTFRELAGAIMRDDPAPLTSLRVDAPADLDRIVRRCLHKQPSDRFQSALELANELRALKRLVERGTPPPGPAAQPSASIAVLPFVNRSANAEDEYFSDGLADELLSLLARIKGLRVSARASSFYFRGQHVPLAEVGRALNVATLLDGSVRRAGNRVRISVHLIKVSDGYHLWSETYDRTLDDIFAVQDDIAQSVVKELRATLLGEEADSDARGRVEAEVHQASRGRSTDPEAHRLYLLARHFMDQYSRESTRKAISYLEQAVARDPGFALAWSELSVAYVREVGFGLVPPDGFSRARQAVERSLQLEPSLADGHAQYAWIQLFHDWDWRGAETSLNYARELAPGSTSVLRLSGVLAGVRGRTQEAIAIFQKALEQDPLSAAAYHSLGFGLFVVDDFAGAEESFRKALELAPQRIGTRVYLAFTLLARGRHEEALAEAAREPEAGYRLSAAAIVHAALGHQAESEDALRRLIDDHAVTYAIQVAEVQAHRQDVDAAFHWLDRAYATRDTGLPRLKINPLLRGLHGDPRWRGLLMRMGLEE